MSYSSDMQKEEKYWKKALFKSKNAAESGSLIPLKTKVIKSYGKDEYKFEVRYMLSQSPLHLVKKVPKENPFQPWNKDLEISPIGSQHTLILNKYPVQLGHMLLITNTWAPQKGWLTKEDWKALETVDKDTCGLWFFNSGPQAGASQPHRHIQLLRRNIYESYCPRDKWFEDILNQKLDLPLELSNCLAITQRREEDDARILHEKYLTACNLLHIGSPKDNVEPMLPYNLLISKTWIAAIKRSQEGCNGFSINALGFAGYLLATDETQLLWLDKHGPETLLRLVTN